MIKRGHFFTVGVPCVGVMLCAILGPLYSSRNGFLSFLFSSMPVSVAVYLDPWWIWWPTREGGLGVLSSGIAWKAVPL